MAKIILVESCKECPIAVENSRHYLVCPSAKVSANIIGKIEDDLDIPDWCPLVSLDEYGDSIVDNIVEKVAERI